MIESIIVVFLICIVLFLILRKAIEMFISKCSKKRSAVPVMVQLKLPPRQKSIGLPPNTARNFYAEVPHLPARFPYYSNMCPEQQGTMTKFKIPLQSNCLRQL
jgi:hypothetical protein